MTLRTFASVLVLLFALPAAAHASPKQWMTFEAPSELLSDASRDATLDEIRSFGVDRVRALAYWRDFAPDPKSKRRPAFDAANPDAYPAGTWTRLDRLFDAAGKRGIQVQLTLTGPVPRWATRSKKGQYAYPSPTEFRSFAAAVGRRYGSRVAVWSIWNEPNHPGFLRPQYKNGKARSPQLYRRLFNAGVAGLNASGNGGDLILMGETAPRGTSKVVAPLKFLRGALCLNRSYRKRKSCGTVAAGGWAHHAYTTKTGPRFKPRNRDDVTIGVLGRLVRALKRAEKAKALPRRTGIYLTEFGIQSKPDPYVGVSLKRQAEYLAIAERMAYFRRRVKSFSQYLLRDDQPRPGPKYARYSGFESGLKRHDGRAKPAYRAFRLPLAVRRGKRRNSAWGRVRPHRAPTTVALLSRRGKSWKVLERVTTNRHGAFRASVPKRKRYRLRWTAPDGRVFTGPSIRPYG